jgi:choline dehydrogenase-like flavoprotein
VLLRLPRLVPRRRSAGVDIAKSVYKAIVQANAPPLPSKSVARALSALPAATLAYVASLTRATSLVRHFQVQSMIEPVPDRENRVTLLTRRDALGLNRAHLAWRIGELEKRTHFAALRAIKKEIEGRGLGQVRFSEDIDDSQWESLVLPTNHQMGTTRMSEDPRFGVVDPTCRVHGYENLFVAGSSVFPTGAGQPPTFTIVALALRLAETVVASLRVLPLAG